MNEKKKKKKEQSVSLKSPPEATVAAKYYKHLDNSFQNEFVLQQQKQILPVDTRDENQLAQDTATAVANSLLSDKSVAVNPAVRRSLSALIPLRDAVNFRTASGPTKKMSLANARKEILQCKMSSKKRCSPSSKSTVTASTHLATEPLATMAGQTTASLLLRFLETNIVLVETGCLLYLCLDFLLYHLLLLQPLLLLLSPLWNHQP